MTTSNGEPLMDDDRLVLAEVKTLVGTIREDIHEMREEIRRSNENKVTRLEWMQRNGTVDDRFEGHGKEISDIKQTMATRSELEDVKKEVQSKRLSLPVVAAVIISGLALAWSILGPTLTGS